MLHFHPWVIRWFILTACLAASPRLARPQSLHTADAIYASARLASLDPAGKWSFQLTELGEQAISSEEVVRWGSWPGIQDEQAVWMSDGSWLAGELRFDQPEMLTVDSDWLQSVQVALPNLRGLVWNPPASLPAWVKLQEQMLASQGSQDTLWLTNRRKISGVIRWLADGEQNRLEVDTAGRVISLAMDEVRAIVFSPTLAGRLPAYSAGFQVGLVDGSLLNVSAMSPAAGTVTLQMHSSLQFTSLDPPRGFAQSVVYLASMQHAADHLSQRRPASYRQLSDSTLTWPLGEDRSVFGLPLANPQGLLFRGLAMHSDSQAAYRWDGSAGRLLAEVQMAPPQPAAHSRLGSVRCQVMLARDGALESVSDFSLSRATDAADQQSKLLDVDVTGAKLIVLVVESSDYGQYADHVQWLDARIAAVESAADSSGL